eukprot:m.115161 g.115161  ORF g.115161 m.115161 type:complete len:312 (+) comp16045_c0_seq1:52-987(+)
MANASASQSSMSTTTSSTTVQLEFQDFSHTTTTTTTSSSSHAASSFSIPIGAKYDARRAIASGGDDDDMFGDNTDRVQLLTEPAGGSRSGGSQSQQRTPSSGSPAIWTLEYYQQFFDVDTEQVVSRVRNSLWPLKNDFLRKIQGRGDLYGPFWISTTLVFLTAMSGNVAHWFATTEEERVTWQYDFSKVSLAATTIYSYVTLVPFAVWLWLRWKVTNSPTLLDVFCVYGYSIFTYIPVAMLCAVPQFQSAGRWGLILTAMGFSGAVLLLNFYAVLSENKSPALMAMLLFVAGAHLALAMAFKLYFFDYAAH